MLPGLFCLFDNLNETVFHGRVYWRDFQNILTFLLHELLERRQRCRDVIVKDDMARFPVGIIDAIQRTRLHHLQQRENVFGFERVEVTLELAGVSILKITPS